MGMKSPSLAKLSRIEPHPSEDEVVEVELVEEELKTETLLEEEAAALIADALMVGAETEVPKSPEAFKSAEKEKEEVKEMNSSPE